VPDGVGDTLPEILAHRPHALKMMREVEAGQVGAILAYRQDRLARDSFTVHLMCRVAKRAKVPIVIPRGDITAREQRLLTAVEGGMDEEEGTRAKERVGAAMDTMRDRGDDIGGVPLGWSKVKLTEPGINSRGEPAKVGARVLVRTDPGKPARIVELYRAIGSYNGTAKRLNDDGVPPPNPKQRRGSAGPPMWSAATVRDIVQREAPDLAKQASARPRTGRAFLFKRLLRCHCGAPMTVSGNPRGIQYYCNRGKRGTHRPYSVSETRLRPWIEEEAARLVDRDEYFREGDEYDDSAERRSLEAMRAAIGEDAYALAVANLDAKRAEHGERERIVLDVPDRIDFNRWAVEDINRALLSLWEFVELGPDLLPVRAQWRFEEWRA
jgi:DNA invertase Pin-like site-specific DNA recombinase